MILRLLLLLSSPFTRHLMAATLSVVKASVLIRLKQTHWFDKGIYFKILWKLWRFQFSNTKKINRHFLVQGIIEASLRTWRTCSSKMGIRLDELIPSPIKAARNLWTLNTYRCMWRWLLLLPTIRVALIILILLLLEANVNAFCPLFPLTDLTGVRSA